MRVFVQVCIGAYAPTRASRRHISSTISIMFSFLLSIPYVAFYIVSPLGEGSPLGIQPHLRLLVSSPCSHRFACRRSSKDEKGEGRRRRRRDNIRAQGKRPMCILHNQRVVIPQQPFAYFYSLIPSLVSRNMPVQLFS